MTNPALARELSDLFKKTGHAHHQAFIETDGDDPDWPLFYADRLHSTLGELVGTEFTTSELVYLLVLVDKEHRASAPNDEWPTYYARFFIDRYPRRSSTSENI